MITLKLDALTDAVTILSIFINLTVLRYFYGSQFEKTSINLTFYLQQNISNDFHALFKEYQIILIVENMKFVAKIINVYAAKL